MKSFVIVFVVSLVAVGLAPSASARIDCSRYGLSSNGVGGCMRPHFGSCLQARRIVSAAPE
jgi:hypothetical protein